MALLEKQAEAKGLKEYLQAFNELFNQKITMLHMHQAKAKAIAHLYELERYLHPNQIGATLQTSLQYAIYQIAKEYGFIDDKEPDPLIKYGTIRSRYLEVMDLRKR